jgi:hypothetical protein
MPLNSERPCLSFSSDRKSGSLRKLRPDRFELRKIPAKNRVLAHTVLQTGEVGFQFYGHLFRQAVDHPIPVPCCLHQTMRFQVSEMLGYLHLRFIEEFLKMAYAQRPLTQKVENAEPGAVTKTLIDLNEVHRERMLKVEGSGRRS